MTANPKTANPKAATPKPLSADPPTRRSPMRILLPILLVGGVAAGIYGWFWQQSHDSAIQLSGRLEGYETDLAAKVGGRIQRITVREGDAVKPGAVLIELTDDAIKAQAEAAQAQIATRQAQVEQARLQLDILRTQIQEAQLNLEQSSGDARGRIQQAEASISGAEAALSQSEAQVVQAESDLKLAQLNRDRVQSLAREGAISQQQLDQAETTVAVNQAVLAARQAAVEAARKQVLLTQGSLVQAQAVQLNPSIRQSQIAGIQQQVQQAQSRLVAAESDVKQAQAQAQQIQVNLNDLQVLSPIEGIVTARTVEPGAVVTSGKTLLTILDLSSVYMRGFVPEGDIGKIKVGQSAKVYLDAFPDQPLAGKVIAIDPQASFTPENIYFRNDRVKQVFGLKIQLLNPGGFAKPGMPADAELVAGEL